jgi:hypothetical protein
MGTLYKYLSPRTLQPLTDETLRFTQPDHLKDPFECLPRTILADTPETANAKFDRLALELNPKLEAGKVPPVREEWVADILRRDNHSDDDLAFQLKLQKVYSSRMGILSLSASNDSILLWSHYCDKHAGYAIGLDTEHEWFKEAVQGEFFGTVREVTYSEKRPEMIGAGERKNIDSFDFLFQKGTDWSYEEEWRFVLPLEKCEESAQGVFVRKFPRNLIP